MGSQKRSHRKASTVVIPYRLTTYCVERVQVVESTYVRDVLVPTFAVIGYYLLLYNLYMALKIIDKDRRFL